MDEFEVTVEHWVDVGEMQGTTVRVRRCDRKRFRIGDAGAHLKSLRPDLFGGVNVDDARFANESHFPVLGYIDEADLALVEGGE